MMARIIFWGEMLDKIFDVEKIAQKLIFEKLNFVDIKPSWDPGGCVAQW